MTSKELKQKHVAIIKKEKEKTLYSAPREL